MLLVRSLGREDSLGSLGAFGVIQGGGASRSFGVIQGGASQSFRVIQGGASRSFGVIQGGGVSRSFRGDTGRHVSEFRG